MVRRVSGGCSAPNWRFPLVALAIGLSAGCWLPFRLGAQEPSPAPLPDKTTQRPVRPADLAGKRYADRQRATMEMWRSREQSRQAVQEAARNPDPEIAQRAAWILRQWRSGALPGVSGDAQNLLQRDGTSALAIVLEQGAFDAVLIAVEESAGTIEFDQIKRQVAQMITGRYPMYVDGAHTNGTEEALLKLIRAVAVNREMVIAEKELAAVLRTDSQDAPPPTVDLPPAAEQWTPFERDVAKSEWAFLSGDVDRAVELARSSGDVELTRVVQMIGGRWDALTEDAFAAAAAATDNEQRAEAYAWGLAGAFHAGNAERMKLALDFLNQKSTNDSERARDFRWHSLAVHERIDAAIDVLQQDEPLIAAKIAVEGSRFERAFEVLGFPPQQVGSRLEEWITDAYVEQAQLPIGNLSPAIERLYVLAKLLIQVGRHDEAFRIYQRLTPREVIIDPRGVSLREQTIRELERVKRLDWIKQLAVEPGENTISAPVRYFVALSLSTESTPFQTVLDQMKLIAPDAEYHERFQITFDLFRGVVPEGITPSEDFKKLLDSLIFQPPPTRRSGRNVAEDGMALDAEIIDLFLRHGQVELAREAQEILARSGDIDAMLALAEGELRRGDRSAAGRWLQEVAMKSSRFEPGNAVVTPDEGLNYAKSIVGQWVLAQRAGHRDLAEDLERRLRLMLTSPSLSFRKGIADHLRQLKQYELAVEVLRDLILHVSFGGSDSPDFFRVAVTYVGCIEDLKESQPDGLKRLGVDPYDAVRWGDLAVLGIMGNGDYYSSAFVSVPLSIRKSALSYAVENADRDLAQSAITSIAAFDPLNIDFGERMLPKVREKGWGDLADAAFDRLFDRGLDYAATFGTDSTSLNNLAWTAAMNQRRLDEALPLSEIAVMLQPDSVVFRDTLAELLHLLGRTEEALAIETACLLDEPDEWHLYKQIEKYREILKRSAATPENR